MIRILQKRARIPVTSVLWLLPWLALVGAETSNENHTNEDDICDLWVAPSTIPNAGLGAFNGGRHWRSIGTTTAWDVDQVAIPMVDVELHNGHFRESPNHVTTNWRDYLLNFFISPSNFDVDVEFDVADSFPDDTSFFVAGTGSLTCCHFALNNVMEPKTLQMDTLQMHRSTDPGVGAFSPFHGYHTPTIRPVPPYAELFASYGSEWFQEREATIGIVPKEDDWNEAEAFFQNYILFWNAYLAAADGDADLSSNSDTGEPKVSSAEELWDLILLSEHVHEFDNASITFVQTFSSAGKLSNELELALVDLLQQAMDMEVAAFRALPTSWIEAQKAMKVGGLVEYELHKSTRSEEWLQTHGRCLDGIVPGVSPIPQAGRGAFARRSFSKGEIVTHAPLLHIADRSILNMYDRKGVIDTETGYETSERDLDRPMHVQLVVNYCFGRNEDESSLLLCPTGSSTTYINHAPASDANVKIVWATNTSWFDPECLTMTTIELAYHLKTCLAVDFIALKDIGKGEEILLDYGSDWEEAWKRHVDSWQPHSTWASTSGPRYKPAADWNRDKTSPIPTLQEDVGDEGTQLGYLYPDNIRVSCRHPELKQFFDCKILARKELESKPTDGEVHQFEYEAELEIGGESIGVERVRNLLRGDIRFVDAWYSGDQFLPNAFRHEMRLPDELFSESWRTGTQTEEGCAWKV